MEKTKKLGKDAVMNGWAPYYDIFMKVYTLGREKILRKKEIDLAKIEEGNSILEIGCGTGTLTILAKERTGNSGKVCGIDAAQKMIELAKRKAQKRKRDIDFQIGSITNIPYHNNQFDIVLCSFMILHTSQEKRESGFKEIFRVLKNTGSLVILDILNDEAVADIHTSLKQLFSEIETGQKNTGFLLPSLTYIRANLKKG